MPNVMPLANGRLPGAIGHPNAGADIPVHGAPEGPNGDSIIDALLAQSFALHDLAGPGKRHRERREALKWRSKSLRLRHRTDSLGAELLLRDEVQQLLKLLRHELNGLLELLQLNRHDLKDLLELLLLDVRELLQLMYLLGEQLQPLLYRLLSGGVRRESVRGERIRLERRRETRTNPKSSVHVDTLLYSILRFVRHTPQRMYHIDLANGRQFR
jgi:hypothetical protein